MNKVAIVGAGMTKFVSRAMETPKELAYEAVKMALDSCELTIKDIDCVVAGSAVDCFDGIHMKGEYLSDGSGGCGKPFIRHSVGGGTGVFSCIHGWMHIASGLFDLCVVVAEEKMSSCQPHPQGAFLTVYDNIIERPLGLNLLWVVAQEMNHYMKTYGYTSEGLALVSVKNKGNALAHPANMLGAKITVEDVMNSEIISWPVHLLDISSTSDGASAIVLASERLAHRITDKPVWIEGVGYNLDTWYWTSRDLAYPIYVEKAARMAYEMAGIKEPQKEIHIAEPYDPFDFKELQNLEALLLADRGKAVQLTADGVTSRDGNMPVCPSGGLLGVGNPISAAALMKVCEIFWQLRGEAGERQVPGNPKIGLAQAWGDMMQCGTVVICKI